MGGQPRSWPILFIAAETYGNDSSSACCVRLRDVAVRVDAQPRRLVPGLGGRAAMELGERLEALRQAADDRERHRQAEHPCAHGGLGRAADRDPYRAADPGPGRGYTPWPVGDAPVSRMWRSSHELPLEQPVVVAEVVAEERERLDERAAADHDLRAAAREEVDASRTPGRRGPGSSELSTVTALVSRIRFVRAAAAASTTAGADTANSGRWCSPTPKTSRPTSSASSISSMRSRSRCSAPICPCRVSANVKTPISTTGFYLAARGFRCGGGPRR